MSDENAIKWRKVAKSVKTCLENSKTRQNLATDDWQLFLENLKRDTSTIQRLYKFLEARGESKNGEFRDSGTSRLQNFCQNKAIIKEKSKQRQKKDERVTKELASEEPLVGTRSGTG